MNSGQRSILGCTIIRGLAGTKNFLDVLSPYVISLFFLHDLESNMIDMRYVRMCSNICESLAIIISFYLVYIVHFKPMLVISILTLSVGLFICLFTVKIEVFTWIFSITTGIGSGLTLMFTIWPAWTFYPGLKGTLTAISMSAFLLSIYYAYAIEAGINYDDEAPELINGHHYYRGDVLTHLIVSFCYLSAIVFFVGVFSVMLIRKKKLNFKERKTKKPIEICFTSIIKRFEFWVLLIVIAMITIYEEYMLEMISGFKNIEYKIEKEFIISGIFSRIISMMICGVLIDLRYSIRKLSVFFMIIMLMNSSVLYFFNSNTVKGISFLVISFATAPNILIIAIIVHRVFKDQNKEAFSLVAIGLLIGDFENIYTRYLSLDEKLTFIVFAIAAPLSYLLLYAIKEKDLEKDFEIKKGKKQKKNKDS